MSKPIMDQIRRGQDLEAVEALSGAFSYDGALYGLEQSREQLRTDPTTYLDTVLGDVVRCPDALHHCSGGPRQTAATDRICGNTW